MKPVLSVRGLEVRVNSNGRMLPVLQQIDLTLNAGEMLALVGESGSGKTMAALAIMRLLPPGAAMRGAVTFQGQDLTRLTEPAMRKLRGAGMAMVFQDPLAALNPAQRVGTQIAEACRLHTGAGHAAGRARALALLDDVGIADPPHCIDQYPHQLSGGMRQRVLIAAALAAAPKLLIADEPTSGLDRVAANRILALLGMVRARLGLAVLLISHDLEAVRAHADTVQVLHEGGTVEHAPSAVFFAGPAHPHSRALLAAGQTPVDPAPGTGAPVLSVQDVSVRYNTGFFSRGSARTALSGATFDLRRGECLGIVGASGSGKTTLGRAILHMLPYEGAIMLDGVAFAALRGTARRAQRRRIQAVFQDPRQSLNPTMRIGALIAEPLHLAGLDRAACRAQAASLLRRVGLPNDLLTRLPHQVSGGQAQRVAIARALAAAPDVLVLDEPTSSLDATTQAGVLALLRELAAERGFATILISHDLNAVALLADRIAVIADGRMTHIGHASGMAWPDP